MSTSNRYSDHHDLTLNEICVTAMIPDLDIYRGASILIREHGEDAPLETAQRRQCPLWVISGHKLGHPFMSAIGG